MTRVVVVDGGFAGLEAMRVLEWRPGSKPQVALAGSFARWCPRDSTIIRAPSRCTRCAFHTGRARRRREAGAVTRLDQGGNTASGRRVAIREART